MNLNCTEAARRDYSYTIYDIQTLGRTSERHRRDLVHELRCIVEKADMGFSWRGHNERWHSIMKKVVLQDLTDANATPDEKKSLVRQLDAAFYSPARHNRAGK
jgi:hypothetical protein